MLWICLKDLRQRLRDRTILLLGLLGPFVVASVVGLAFGSGMHVRARLAVADLDGSDASQRLVEIFTSEGDLGDIVDLDRVDSEDAAREAVARSDADAAIVVPPGFGAAATDRGNTPVSVTVLVDPTEEIQASIAEGAVRQYVGGIATVRLAYATAAAAGAGPGLASAPPPAPTAPLAVDAQAVFQLGPVDYFGPSMGLMFLYFTVLFGAATFVREVRTHTLARLAAAPVRSRNVIVGKLAALFVIGVVEMVVLIASTSLVYHVPWGRLVPLSVLVFSTVLSAIGLTGIVSAVSRTEEQARSVGAAVILGLALFGGQFFMSAGMPEVFRTIQAATPTGAALRGFTDLMIAGGSGSLATVAWPVAFTAALGVALTAIGAWLFERRMRR